MPPAAAPTPSGSPDRGRQLLDAGANFVKSGPVQFIGRKTKEACMMVLGPLWQTVKVPVDIITALPKSVIEEGKKGLDLPENHDKLDYVSAGIKSVGAVAGGTVGKSVKSVLNALWSPFRYAGEFLGILDKKKPSGGTAKTETETPS